MLNIDHNTRTRTWRELINELTDALISNPQLADQPAAFSTDSAEAISLDNATDATIYYVRGFTEDDGDSLVMTRGL